MPALAATIQVENRRNKPMKPIILKSHEVIHLRDTGSVIAWRVVKPQPEFCGGEGEERDHSKWGDHCMDRSPTFVPVKDWPCPYGRTGEQRFVKEVFRIFDSGVECGCHDQCSCARYNGKPVYRADCDDSEAKWRSSIHMKEAQSRFTVTLDVGLKRIQEVTEEEAEMSGCECVVCGRVMDGRSEDDCHCFHAKAGRSDIWITIESTNPGSWDRNDYFWSIKCTLTK